MQIGSSTLASAKVPSGQSGTGIGRAGAQSLPTPQPTSAKAMRSTEIRMRRAAARDMQRYRATVQGSAAITCRLNRSAIAS